MMKRFINIAILLCLFSIINGQNNSDKIINYDGSIISGSIKDKGSYEKGIQFKSNAESDYILLNHALLSFRRKAERCNLGETIKHDKENF